MDPVSMVAVTAAGLFATKVIEEAGTQTGRGLSTAAGRLAAWMRRRGEEHVETQAALTMVQAKPADSARVQLLGHVLAERAREDPALARELTELVGEADLAGDVRLVIGGAHIHGGVSGHARVNQAGGDQIQLRNQSRS